jgi:hypothetical protein
MSNRIGLYLTLPPACHHDDPAFVVQSKQRLLNLPCFWKKSSTAPPYPVVELAVYDAEPGSRQGNPS